ncbi:FadR/GntR family transcriptional regulator [Asticcacaulis sp. BYS171W]|uniref:FadR/GntR family transcriptional regulator n=1 Tax=Asticcacaulis aquaticus TaxID=2984212 RepID=A0ABT5HYK1_9CAUL|nr:FadR/GntR family transcriptional regulator [Asticcacaulis aquaticus]MDC7685013.1 FadR/GntR family transcriptional regulator [Asticcacaulis aquaticus]
MTIDTPSHPPLRRTPVSDQAQSFGLTFQGRLHGALAHRLGVDILKGVYAPGQVLPNEIDSSSTLDISRSAYREAIRILAAKGMVESRPKAGTKVTERKRWNILDPEVLGWMFETEPSEDFIKGLFELRLITEPAAAELAALRRTEAHLKQMDAALDVMEAETLATEAGRRADLEFHDALMNATGNEALASLSHSIGAAVAWSTRFKQRSGPLLRDPVPDHRRVYDAIKRQDAGAARWCMESLIRMALDDTQRTMKTQLIEPRG